MWLGYALTHQLQALAAASSGTCAVNVTNGTFWDHTKCNNGTCCETVWSPTNAEECCGNCKFSEFGFECVAWEWFADKQDCYICSKEVLEYRGKMDGHTTGCLNGLC